MSYFVMSQRKMVEIKAGWLKKPVTECMEYLISQLSPAIPCDLHELIFRNLYHFYMPFFTCRCCSLRPVVWEENWHVQP